MRTITAVVLAGGRGCRMGSITQSTQKCLLPIDEQPVIFHIMKALVSEFGSVDLIVGVAYRANDVVDFIDRNKPRTVSVTYVPHILGTEGWGIYRDLRPFVHGPFVAMPGDIVAMPHVYGSVMRVLAKDEADAAITLSPDVDTVDTHGIGYINQSRAVNLQWPPPQALPSNCLRDMTIWSSDERIFDIIERYPHPGKSIGYVFMDAIHDKRPISGNYYDASWIHLGYPSDLQKSLAVACSTS
ncbi:MAG: NDP-sugar synthase [Patescibacteria group bacterium]